MSSPVDVPSLITLTSCISVACKFRNFVPVGEAAVPSLSIPPLNVSVALSCFCLDVAFDIFTFAYTESACDTTAPVIFNVEPSVATAMVGVIFAPSLSTVTIACVGLT